MNPIRHPRIFTRKSDWTGKENEMVIWMTDEQFAELESPTRRHIQEILPDCSPTEREFLLTGMSAAEQHTFFGEEAD
jgi:hypothetical protein